MKRLRTLAGLSALLVALNACGPAPTSTPTMTPIPPPSSTPTPTATPTTPTLTPTNPPLPEGAVARMTCGVDILKIAYSPVGTLLTAASLEAIFICDMETLTLQTTIVPEHEMPGGISWSPDGTRLAGALGNGVLSIWDGATGEKWADLEVSDGGFFLAWSPVGERLVISVVGGLRVWDVAAREERVSMTHLFSSFYSVVAWSPDGRRVAGGDISGNVEVFDALTGRELAHLILPEDWPGSSVFSVAWSPDGKWLASGTGEHVLIYDTTTGEQLVTLRPSQPRSPQSLAWSPDGRWLASGDLDGLVQVWDTSTWEKRAVIAGLGKVYGVVWSPDGEYLVSGSADGTVILWDVGQLP